MLYRAYAVCSDWIYLHEEVERIRQILVNNNFPIQIVDETINQFLSKKFDNSPKINTVHTKPVIIYYRNQYNSKYQTQEKQLRRAISKNLSATTPKTALKLEFIIKTENLRVYS